MFVNRVEPTSVEKVWFVISVLANFDKPSKALTITVESLLFGYRVSTSSMLPLKIGVLLEAELMLTDTRISALIHCAEP